MGMINSEAVRRITMSEQQIYLKHVTREDVRRVQLWLTDDRVVESWFGRYSYGNPAHLGYHPEQIEGITEDELRWLGLIPSACSPHADGGQHKGDGVPRTLQIALNHASSGPTLQRRFPVGPPAEHTGRGRRHLYLWSRLRRRPTIAWALEKCMKGSQAAR